MKINKQTYNDVAVIELHGELEADIVDSFENAISETIADSPAGIVLDLSAVEFIDSVGLESLIWARDYCNDNRCGLRMAGLTENSRKILEITRLRDEFDAYDELAEAVKSFA
ncbi:MAG TPA: anti-sigma factor antagonist [Phycisphaerales bacterium]|nr:anti-sigma factor antagonist [Phycisphaerales bacterium]